MKVPQSPNWTYVLKIQRYAFLTVLLLCACSAATEPPAPAPPNADETRACVEQYDPTVDYFPDKAQLAYAEGWTIDYFNHYKVITVLTPWQESDQTFEYLLVQCGTPTPDGFEHVQTIEVPAESIITMSTTYLPHLDELNLLDRLVGLDNIQFVNNPAVVTMHEEDALTEVGSGAEVNVEQVLTLAPSLVMAYGSGNPQTDVHPQLLAAGVPVAINAEYTEPTPLGRAEWLKFTAAFFNREALAESAFHDMSTTYEELVSRVSEVNERPSVLVNAPFEGTWYMSGGQSYIANLLKDAGTSYLWADDTSTGSLPLSVETVFDRGIDAEYWFHPGTVSTIDALLAIDDRLAQFRAVDSGQVYNNNRRLNAFGGNDFWESGVTHPDLVLADLIAIVHPTLLPDHELYYYQQVK
ncbi:MAG: ABC transporter substrate-binding protein [Chloroflexaceae bacterium]|nr:ABC transporter substrate-binding protein [Chloroflexaceae bacterium]